MNNTTYRTLLVASVSLLTVAVLSAWAMVLWWPGVNTVSFAGAMTVLSATFVAAHIYASCREAGPS